MANQPNSMQYTWDHMQELNDIGMAIDAVSKLYRDETIAECVTFIDKITGFKMPTRREDESQEQFVARLQAWFDRFKQNCYTAEFALFPNREHSNFRREVLNGEPLFNNLEGQSGSDNTDFNQTNRLGSANVTSSTRQRTYDENPVAAYIYSACMAVASDLQSRTYVNQLAAQGQKVPRILDEFMKSVRVSNVGFARVAPAIQPLPDDVIQILGLRRTLLDWNYIISPQGVATFINFLQRLENIPSNYVVFVGYSRILPFEAGHTMTHMAWHWDQSEETESEVLVEIQYRDSEGKVQVLTSSEIATPDYRMALLPGHSYGTKLNAVHYYDANIFGRYLINNSGDTISSEEFSKEFRPITTNRSFAMYVVKRVCEQLVNDPGASLRTKFGTDGDSSTTPSPTPPPTPTSSDGARQRAFKGKGKGKGSPPTKSKDGLSPSQDSGTQKFVTEILSELKRLVADLVRDQIGRPAYQS